MELYHMPLLVSKLMVTINSLWWQKLSLKQPDQFNSSFLCGFLCTCLTIINSFQEHKKAETAYYWLYFLLGILIPLILLAFCNAMLIKALRESMKMRQLHSSTSTR